MRREGQAPHHSHCRARESMLLVFELDFQVDACVCQQFMMLFKVSHLNILWTLLSAISTRQPSLPALAFQHMTCSKITLKIYYPQHAPCGKCSGQLDGTLCLQAKSIQSIRLLASAQGNEMEVYAFRQEVSRAYTFWRVPRAMARSTSSIHLLVSAQGNGKKYPTEHTPFSQCSGQWQEVSLAAQHMPFGECSGQMEVFAFKQEVFRA